MIQLKTMNTHKVLALAPYSQRLGVAVLDRSELLHFSVKTFNLPRTVQSIRRETRNELSHLIERHRPSVVVLKALSKRQNSSQNQQTVTAEARQVATACGIPVINVAFEKVKRDVVHESMPTDLATFDAVKKRYPELRKLGNFQNRHQREYYRPLFTAVTLGFSKTTEP